MRGFADGGESGIDFLHSNGAVVNVHIVAALVGNESDMGDFSFMRFTEMGGNFRAIVVFLWRADGGVDGEVCVGVVLQELLDLEGLLFKLGWVGDVLVLAAATLSVEFALWGATRWRRG